tara:strand:+ start:739 stop:969 length:231 start_codon:yes stop_codon:yes gene_type:complete
MSKSNTNKPPGDIPTFSVSKHDFILSLKGCSEKREDVWDIEDLLSPNDYPPEAEEQEKMTPTHYIESKVLSDEPPF